MFKTRVINKKGGQYFGPYSNVASMYTVLALIHKVHKQPTRRLPLTEEGIRKGAFRPCLEYHLHNCLGPCTGKQSKADDLDSIEQATESIKGNTREISDLHFERMQDQAEKMEFEEAEIIKQQYLLVRNYCAKSEVVSHTVNNIDVFSIVNDDMDKMAFINYMHVAKGSINQAFTFEYKRKLNETDEELLTMAIPQIRERFHSEAKEIVVPFELEWHMGDITFTIPQRGEKRHLLDLSTMNGKQYKVDRLKRSEKLNPEQKTTRLLKELQQALGMKKMPYQIECFDNSNISGADAVAGCVVFKGMKPSKKDYRKYIIKTVVGPDDYASMQEVVRRRYSRMIEEDSPLPDLIITDGGKGQMEVVRQVVEDELHLDIAIAGLAKDDKHRTNELLFGFPPVVVGMKTNSELFHALTRIQDEVHRYAITFHRDKRSKHAVHSELDSIKGIGPKTKETLLKHFKSVKRIREASVENVKAIIGEKKGEILWQQLHAE